MSAPAAPHSFTPSATPTISGPTTPPPFEPSFKPPYRVRFDVAVEDVGGLRKAVATLLAMIDESPDSNGWSFGAAHGNGVAEPVRYRLCCRGTPPALFYAPLDEPLPEGCAFVE